ncbi:MAG: hypothetical protein QXO16_03330 [Archaeoglobaceae archaeon]
MDRLALSLQHSFGIQTNCFLLTEEDAEFLKEKKVNVGDFPRGRGHLDKVKEIINWFAGYDETRSKERAMELLGLILNHPLKNDLPKNVSDFIQRINPIQCMKGSEKNTPIIWRVVKVALCSRFLSLLSDSSCRCPT